MMRIKKLFYTSILLIFRSVIHFKLLRDTSIIVLNNRRNLYIDIINLKIKKGIQLRNLLIYQYNWTLLYVFNSLAPHNINQPYSSYWTHKMKKKLGKFEKSHPEND